MPSQPEPHMDEERALFRRTLARVMIAQVVALLLLWLLQNRYTP